MDLQQISESIGMPIWRLRQLMTDIPRVFQSNFDDFTYSRQERKHMSFYTHEPDYNDAFMQHLIYCSRALYDYYGLLAKEYLKFKKI